MTSAKNKPNIPQLIFYLLITIAVLTPVWSFEWFHTGDGSAHLYCANVFNQLLFNKQSLFHQFFELNIKPVPNSIVQLLLSLLLLIFSAQLTVKMVTSIVIILFCGGYFLLNRQLAGGKSWTPLLIFTIVFNYALIMGFYSFIMSLGMMMICIAFYLKNHEEWNKKKYITFSILLLITWFSHFFGFAATLLFVFISELIRLFNTPLQPKSKFNFKQILFLFICALPVLLLTLLFADKASGATKVKFLDMDDLLNRLNNVTALITYNNDIEKYNIIGIEIIIGALIVAGIFFKFFHINRKILCALVGMIITTVILYFTMPYEFFAGGYINVRLMLVMILFIMILVDCVQLNKPLTIVKSLCILIVCFSAASNQLSASGAYNEELKEFYSGVSYIEDNTVVLPIGYTENWLQYDFPLYLSAEKNLVVLDNNEALSPNSLVRWKSNNVFDNMGTCGQSNRPLFQLKKYEDGKSFKVEYIIRWVWSETYNDSTTLITNKEIENGFNPIYCSAGKRMEVFKRK